MSLPNIEVIFEDDNHIIVHQFSGGYDLPTALKIYQTCRLPFVEIQNKLPKLTVKITVNGTAKAVGYGIYEDTITVCPHDLLERLNIDLAEVLEAMIRQPTNQPGYLKQDRIRRSRGHWVTAWRVTDADDNDLITPWAVSRAQAIKAANDLGILMQEDRRK